MCNYIDFAICVEMKNKNIPNYESTVTEMMWERKMLIVNRSKGEKKKKKKTEMIFVRNMFYSV